MTDTTGTTGAEWPTASLDRVQRMRVLAAGIPNAAMAEALLDAPFARVWSWFSDLEHSVPSFDGEVRRLHIRRRAGARLAITSWAGPGGLVPVPFDVLLEDGWCLMTAAARAYVVGMCAEPVGAQTRVAILEAMPRSVGRWARSSVTHHVRGDVRRMGRALGVSATAMSSWPEAADPARRRRGRG